MSDLLFVLSIITNVVVLAVVLRLAYDRQGHKVSEAKAEDAEPVEDLSDLPPEEARAVDPNHPPYYTYYRPEVYSTERAPSCTCHGLKVRQGEKVLLWPIPNHPEGGIDVFCAQTYDQGIED